MDSILYEYEKEICKYKPFTKEEEIEYFKRYQNKEDVKNIIFNHYAGLVIYYVKSFCNKYNIQNLSVMDLIEYGNMGLLLAIDKYDLSYNCRFSTIAFPYIKQTIFAAIQDNDSLIRIPIYKKNEIRSFSKQLKELTITLNREPTNKEIAKYINKSLKYVIELKKIMILCNIGSLNTFSKKTTKDNLEILYMINDEDCNVEHEVINNIKYEFVNDILDKIKLTYTEKQTLMYRFDFFDCGKKTLEEISNILKLSKQRINQLETSAINKIRKSPYIYELALYMNNPNEKLLSIGKTKEQIERNLEKVKKI